jgi:hypothetical protein
MPGVTVPALVVHATADTEIRRRQAREIADAAGSDDVTYEEIAGARHLEGATPPCSRRPRLTCGSPGTKNRGPVLALPLRQADRAESRWFRLRRAVIDD